MNSQNQNQRDLGRGSPFEYHRNRIGSSFETHGDFTVNNQRVIENRHNEFSRTSLQILEPSYDPEQSDRPNRFEYQFQTIQNHNLQIPQNRPYEQVFKGLRNPMKSQSPVKRKMGQSTYLVLGQKTGMSDMRSKSNLVERKHQKNKERQDVLEQQWVQMFGDQQQTKDSMRKVDSERLETLSKPRFIQKKKERDSKPQWISSSTINNNQERAQIERERLKFQKEDDRKRRLFDQKHSKFQRSFLSPNSTFNKDEKSSYYVEERQYRSPRDPLGLYRMEDSLKIPVFQAYEDPKYTPNLSPDISKTMFPKVTNFKNQNNKNSKKKLDQNYESRN